MSNITPQARMILLDTIVETLLSKNVSSVVANKLAIEIANNFETRAEKFIADMNYQNQLSMIKEAIANVSQN